MDGLFGAVGEYIATHKGLGVILIRQNREVLHCSSTAQALLGAGNLSITDGILHGDSGFDQRLLESSLEARPDHAFDPQSCIVFGRRSPCPLFVSLANAREDSFVVMLRGPRSHDDSEVWLLMETFALTKREAQIANHLCCGGTLAEFAADQFLAMNTVKTHLKQVFKKVGVKNQLQVAVMMLGALR
jgi:DNA-binding CsgD family transcriptional regulator